MNYPGLARKAIRQYLETGELLEISGELRQQYLEKKGVFVSLKKKGALRGCIGTISGQSTLLEEIVRNAVASATEDPRFPPVTLEETDLLDISVDVLEHPEPVRSAAELDPRIYGIIVSQGYRRGLLLPDLEGVDTVEMQIAIAKEKAGIMGNQYQLEKFKVTSYEE